MVEAEPDLGLSAPPFLQHDRVIAREFVVADVILTREDLPVAAQVEDEAAQRDDAGCLVQQPPDAEHLPRDIALDEPLGDQRVLETRGFVFVLMIITVCRKIRKECRSRPFDHRYEIGGRSSASSQVSPPGLRAIGFELPLLLGRHVALADRVFVVVAVMARGLTFIYSDG